MRDILFRGKNPDNNEWVEGSLVHRSLFYGDPANEYFILIGGEFHCDFYNAVAVDPKSIGQYTGLTDKNGTKIFEGDVVLVNWFEHNGKFVVDYEGGSFFPYQIGCKLNFNSLWDVWFQDNDGTILEVIGNVHDNPDLLIDHRAD